MNGWLGLTTIACTVGLVGCAPLALNALGVEPFARVDRRKMFSREGWGLPGRVVEALVLQPGSKVADIGAGDGYFTFRLAEAVGPSGHVYAVEVTDKLIKELEEEIQRRGCTNITVVRGDSDDPKLPDAGINLAFVSAVFHHLDQPSTYFTKLHKDLAPQGRIAIIEGPPDPLHKLFMPFHFAAPEDVAAALGTAGYQLVQSFDLLPMMSFQVFEASS